MIREQPAIEITFDCSKQNPTWKKRKQVVVAPENSAFIMKDKTFRAAKELAKGMVLANGRKVTKVRGVGLMPCFTQIRE